MDARFPAIAALLVLAAVTPAAGADVRVATVDYGGPGVVTQHGNTVLVWQSTSQSVTANVDVTGSDGRYEVCLDAYPENGSSSIDVTCAERHLGAGESQNVTVSFGKWPSNFTGRASLDLTVRPAGTSNGTAANASVDVLVLRSAGDVDGDGLSNQREVKAGSNVTLTDTDGDGLDDAAEVTSYDTKPTKADTDGDGLDDEAEVNKYKTDPTTAHTDDDRLNDTAEIHTYGTDPNKADTDDDGLDDDAEINIHGTDPNDPDTDSDDLSDGAEVNEHDTNPNKADTDDDELSDGVEVHTHGTDPNKLDTDDDGLGDAAELQRENKTDPTDPDSDDDGLDDGIEVNTHGTLPNKADTDGDGLDDGAEIKYGMDPHDPDTDDDGTGDRQEVDRPLIDPAVGAGALAVLVAVGGTVVLWRRDRLPSLAIPESWPGRPWGDDSSGEPASSETVDDADVAAVGGDEPDAASPRTPLTNEEHVLAVLDESGGRTLQSDIVDETEWSKSKVSRVLSTMEDDGLVTKIDVGRENVIARAGEEPESAKPPFDE